MSRIKVEIKAWPSAGRSGSSRRSALVAWQDNMSLVTRFPAGCQTRPAWFACPRCRARRAINPRTASTGLSNVGNIGAVRYRVRGADRVLVKVLDWSRERGPKKPVLGTGVISNSGALSKNSA